MNEQAATTEKINDLQPPPEEREPNLLADEELDAASGGARPAQPPKGIIIIGG